MIVSFLAISILRILWLVIEFFPNMFLWYRNFSVNIVNLKRWFSIFIVGNFKFETTSTNHKFLIKLNNETTIILVFFVTTLHCILIISYGSRVLSNSNFNFFSFSSYLFFIAEVGLVPYTHPPLTPLPSSIIIY